MMKKANLYFFGSERISLEDFIWFYGFYAFSGLIVLLIASITF